MKGSTFWIIFFFSAFISSFVFLNLTFLNLMVSQPSFHPMSSLISTILNSIFIGPSFHLLSTLKFNFPSSYFLKPSFHSFPILNFFISDICSAMVKHWSIVRALRVMNQSVSYHKMASVSLIFFMKTSVPRVPNMMMSSIFSMPLQLSNGKCLSMQQETRLSCYVSGFPLGHCVCNKVIMITSA